MNSLDATYIQLRFQVLKHSHFLHPCNNPRGINIVPTWQMMKVRHKEPNECVPITPGGETPSLRSYSTTHHLSATVINPIPGQVRKPKVGKAAELWRGCQTQSSLICALRWNSKCLTWRCQGPGKEMPTLRPGEVPYISQAPSDTCLLPTLHLSWGHSPSLRALSLSLLPPLSTHPCKAWVKNDLLQDMFPDGIGHRCH